MMKPVNIRCRKGDIQKFNSYLRTETQKVVPALKGEVRLSFRVTTERKIVDVKIETSLSKEMDERAKQILVNGPEWLPAKLHGQQPVESFSFVTIQFK